MIYYLFFPQIPSQDENQDVAIFFARTSWIIMIVFLVYKVDSFSLSLSLSLFFLFPLSVSFHFSEIQFYTSERHTGAPEPPSSFLMMILHSKFLSSFLYFFIFLSFFLYNCFIFWNFIAIFIQSFLMIYIRISLSLRDLILLNFNLLIIF